MGAVNSIVLTDGAATPATHTHLPSYKEGGELFVFRESTGVPLADNVITVRSRKTAAGKYKTSLGLAKPIVQTQTINGISQPVVVRTAYANLDFTFDATSTQQERKDIVFEIASLFAGGTNAWFVDAHLVNNEGIF